MAKGLRYFKHVAGIAAKYSKNRYNSTPEVMDKEIDCLNQYHNHVSELVSFIESERAELLARPAYTSEGTWMDRKAACKKYDVAIATLLRKSCQEKAKTRKIGRKIEILVTKSLDERLNTDDRLVDNDRKKEPEPEINLAGRISLSELLWQTHLSYMTLHKRLKQYEINYDVIKSGRQTYFKGISEHDMNLIKHRKKKHESIEDLRSRIGRKEPRTLKGHIRLEDINKILETTDGQILDFMTELDIKPDFVRTYGGKDPQFPKKYLKIFKKMLHEKGAAVQT